MKHLLLSLLVLSSAGCTSVNATADVSGNWVVKQERDFYGNAGVPNECTFTQQRSQLTVKCGTANTEMKGEVRGRTVTWGYEKMYEGIPPMTEDRLILTYRAESNETGTTLKGTWRLTSSVLEEKGHFEAQRK